MPSGIVGIAGVMAIVTNVAGFTVRVVVPEIDPRVAVTPVPPTATLAANPCALTVAMAEFAMLHETDVVTSNVLPSV